MAAVTSPPVADILAALEIPASEEVAGLLAGVTSDDATRYLGRMLTRDAARAIWLDWNPGAASRIEDAHFLRRFHALLVEGISLGYRLGRFRDIASRLPDPDAGTRNWIPLLESTIAQDDCATLRLFLSREQHQLFRTTPRGPAADAQTWDEMLAMMTDGLFYELGLVFRPPEISIDDRLPPPMLRCEWNDLRLPARPGLDDQSVLVNDTPDRLRLLEIPGREAVNPANGNACAIVDKSFRKAAEDAGLTTWDARGYAVLVFSATIRHAAAALVNRPLYDLYLMRLREFNPDAVSAIEETLDPDFVVQVLRGLLAEQVSIRDFPAILQAMVELRSTITLDMAKYIVFAPPTNGIFTGIHRKRVADLTPADYVEYVRWTQKRYISHKYTRGQSTLIVYLMDPKSEAILSASGDIEPDAEAAILAAVRDEVGSLPPSAHRPVILTTTTARRTLRDLVAPEFPGLTVLSYQELSPEMNIQPIARIVPDL
jgi:type III secretory pathway component EscV